MASRVEELIDASRFVVRVQNVSQSIFRDAFDGQQYVIPAGAAAIVPVNAVKLWMGDWTKRNLDAVMRERDWEVERLKIRLAVYSDGWCATHGSRSGKRPDEQCRCEGIRPLPEPALEVFDMAGTRISTILEDPEGLGLDPVVSGDVEKERLLELLREQQMRLRAIESQIAGQGGIAIEDIPEDEGPGEGVAASARRRRKPGGPPAPGVVREPLGEQQ